MSDAAVNSSRVTYFSWLENIYILYLSVLYVHAHAAAIDLNSPSDMYNY